MKIIAVGSNAEKGRALERHVGTLFTTLGYKDLRYNTRKTGEEVDVYGRHRLSDERLKAQCKAHVDLIDSGPLRLFYGDLEKERGINPRTAGLFVSLSSYSGTAYQWYDELDDLVRNYFKLLNGEEFYSELVKEGIVSSLDSINNIINSRTCLPILEEYLLLTERGFFWKVVTTEEESDHKYVSFLNPKGRIVNRSDIEYLLERIPLNDQKHILLQNRHAIIKSLYEGPAKSINEISESIKESEEDVSAVLDELSAQSMIIKNPTEIFLRPEIDTFISLFKEAKTENSLIDFMLSKYFESSIKIVPEYICAKYFVNLSTPEKEVLIKILKVSPKALDFGLLGDSSEFRINEEHIEKLYLPDEKADDIRKQRIHNLLSKIYINLLLDIGNPITGQLMDENEIITSVLRFEIKLGKRFEQYLSLSEMAIFMRAQVDGAINAGQLLSLTGPGPLLTHSDALAAIGEDENAIKGYDKVIELYSDTEAAVAAMNNKGLVFLKNKNTKDAIPLFREVSDHEFAEKIALFNLARCYAIDKNDELIE